MKALFSKPAGMWRRPAFFGYAWLAAVVWWVPAAMPLRAEIPEPPTVFYGQVINRTSGQIYVQTNGTLVWKILPVSGGNPVVLTTALQSLANGTLSYRLSIPHHAVASGATVPAGVVPLSSEGVDYQHLTITVDGFTARIVDDSTDPLHLAQTSRATAYRLDLELTNPLADSDADGLPDWWEDRYGLNKHFAGDAGLDPDHDGASNLKEFKDGTDPNVVSVNPILATTQITALEGGTVNVRLQARDSDSQPADLHYTMLALPAGGTLILRNGTPATTAGQPDSDRPLAINDSFTQADVNAGRLIFRQQDTAAPATSFKVKLNDENPAHPTATSNVAVAVCRTSATDAGKLALWLDANRAASLGASTWSDDSGNHFDALPPVGAPAMFDADSPGGNLSLRLSGGIWDLAVSDEAAAFPAGERTVFAVFRANGNGRQEILGGTRFELGVTATDDAVHSGQLRYATDSGAVYSPRPVQGQWLVASVEEQNGQTQLELNGLWSAGPTPYAETTALANKSAIGGKAVGQLQAATGAWLFQPTELLSGQVAELLVFKRALSSAERQRLSYHLLSKWFGYEVWDASGEARSMTMTVPSAGLNASTYTNYVAAHGRDRQFILLGGAGADELRGGMEADILVGGPGLNRLAGGGGADRFVLGAGAGNDTILDFNPSEGDVLDLSDMLSGASRNLADYVQLSTLGTNSWLGVSTNGAGSGYTNAQITLQNIALRQSDLASLWASGSVVARGLRIEGPPWITVAATCPAASEEGPTSGEFTLTRYGNTDNSLTVNLSLGGSAANGIDYSWISSAITFAPGQSTLKVSVQPYTDSLVEVPEVVEMTVLAGAGYNVGSPSRAQVTIADLPERFTIETVSSVASRSGPTPAYFLLNRSGVLDHSTTARLGFAGTAINGVDYQYIPSVLVFSPGQASALLALTPLTSQPAIDTPKWVQLRVLPDPNAHYLLGSTATGRVWMVEEMLTMGLWRSRSLPNGTNDLAMLAGQDPDQDGMVNLVEYSLGLNPAQPDATTASVYRPRATMRDGHLVVQFKKRIAAVDLNYTVEISSDLVNWQSGDAYLEPVALPELSGQPDVLAFRDRTSSAASHRYIRVRVELQP